MSTYGTTEYNERFGAQLRNLMYEREKTAAMMAKDLKIQHITRGSPRLCRRRDESDNLKRQRRAEQKAVSPTPPTRE